MNINNVEEYIKYIVKNCNGVPPKPGNTIPKIKLLGKRKTNFHFTKKEILTKLEHINELLDNILEII
mgnify:CR=1 FL=1